MEKQKRFKTNIEVSKQNLKSELDEGDHRNKKNPVSKIK
jgi:hypothetical protein